MSAMTVLVACNSFSWLIMCSVSEFLGFSVNNIFFVDSLRLSETEWFPIFLDPRLKQSFHAPVSNAGHLFPKAGICDRRGVGGRGGGSVRPMHTVVPDHANAGLAQEVEARRSCNLDDGRPTWPAWPACLLLAWAQLH